MTPNLRPRLFLRVLSRRWLQYQNPFLLRRLLEFPLAFALQDYTHLFHTARPSPISIHLMQYDLSFIHIVMAPCARTHAFINDFGIPTTFLSCIYSDLLQFSASFLPLYCTSPSFVM